jgi:hypothetical protein
VRVAAILLSASLAACSSIADAPRPADQFFASLAQSCGKSFAGKLAVGDATDAAFANAAMRAHFGECSDREIRIAFDVGEDRSRTWIITKLGEGLRLKHRHMLKDGTEDSLSQYGGDTQNAGTASRQEFPADDYSKAMFVREGRQVSTANIWAFEIKPGQALTYELARPGRLFRVEFDLNDPVPSSQ